MIFARFHFVSFPSYPFPLEVEMNKRVICKGRSRASCITLSIIVRAFRISTYQSMGARFLPRFRNVIVEFTLLSRWYGVCCKYVSHYVLNREELKSHKTTYECNRWLSSELIVTIMQY